MNLINRIALNLSVSLCLFCIAGPTHAQVVADSLWSYESIYLDSDGDDVPDLDGEEVTITGVVNVASGLLHESYLQIFVQTDSSGMSLFSMKIDTPVEVGDSIVATGKVERYFGLTEVHVDSYAIIENVEAPEAAPIKEILNDKERFKGMLLEGSGKVVETGDRYNGSYIVISPENSDESLMVYLSNFHSMYSSFNLDIFSIGDIVSVKGILSEYSPDFPTDRTYKLFLRTPDDIEPVGLPSYYLQLLMIASSVLIVFMIGWAVSIRKRVDSKTKEIQLSLKQKELLLKEIHHRVKNSLSIVSGLIEIQLSGTDNKETSDILQDSQTRIQSVAMIHEKLYKTESLSDIELDYYIKDLVESIHGTFTEYRESVDLHFDLDPILLDTDRAVHCGLLINELIVNAFKYAFCRDKKGILSVSLKESSGKITLRIADNGPGLPSSNDKKHSESLGSMLIDTFAAHLKATKNVSKQADGGAVIEFALSK